MTKRIFTSLLLLLVAAVSFAQQAYYTSIDGIKGGATLKNALYELIKEHKQISYGSGESSTWGAFYTTDAVMENGKRRVLDMYSPEKRYFGSKGSAISGMNIEHSLPKSWWGGQKNNAYCDLHHLNPSDQTANSRKSNYPLGVVTNESWSNGVTTVGKGYVDGSTANVFEPCDEYKGDFARTYMYMFTCYQNLSWEYTHMNYANSTYPTLKPWAIELLMKWHKQDPVSEKEVNRNNAVYEVQGNRNPFIDYPQLADYVWGDSISYTFHLTGEVEDGIGGGGNTGGNDDEEDFETVDGWKIYLDEDFTGSDMPFTTYEAVGNYPWTLSTQYKCAVATSYVNSTNNAADSWLISQHFDFSDDSIATVSFDYVIRYCEEGKAAEYHRLLISDDFDGDVENASWEIIDFDAAENTSDWNFTNSGEIAIPAEYIGKSNVTIAFRYIATTTKAGTFEITNMLVKAMEGGNTSGEDNTGGGEGGGNTSEGGDNGSEGNGGNFTGGSFTLVTDAAQLTIGDSIVIVYENYVLGEQYNNYRQKTDIMISNNTVTYLADDAQVIVLEEGVVDGTFAFNVGNGYLAASSSSSNYLNTVTALDANGSWLITIGSDALAVIIAQGDKTRNTLQYNTSAPRFSCYKSGQKSVSIYAKSPVSTGIVEVAGENGTVNIYNLAGVCVRSARNSVNILDGLAKGIYIVNNRKMLVH